MSKLPHLLKEAQEGVRGDRLAQVLIVLNDILFELVEMLDENSEGPPIEVLCQLHDERIGVVLHVLGLLLVVLI